MPSALFIVHSRPPLLKVGLGLLLALSTTWCWSGFTCKESIMNPKSSHNPKTFVARFVNALTFLDIVK